MVMLYQIFVYILGRDKPKDAEALHTHIAARLFKNPFHLILMSMMQKVSGSQSKTFLPKYLWKSIKDTAAKKKSLQLN